MTEGLYRTGFLRFAHELSQRYELRPNIERRARLSRVRKAKYLVLTYHRVGTQGVPLYCTLPRQVFAEQMAYVARHFRVISIQQMADELLDPDRTGQAIAITFDDGYRGTYTEAYPVLRQYGLPATVYLTAGAVESGEILWYDQIFVRFQKAPSLLKLMLNVPRTYDLRTFQDRLDGATEVVGYLRTLPDDHRQRWCEEFEAMVPLLAQDVRGAMMTWEQVRAMQRDGISFGAHTMTHPVVSRLSPGQLNSELKEAKTLIEERLDHAVEHFAFPFGKASECGIHASEVLASLGFRTAMTSIAGINEHGADLFRLRRLGVGNSRSIAYFALQLHRLLLFPSDEELTASEHHGGIHQN
jgi:peptidoglycan/xylan/chitin deacetylase (PgdA/CDA1 family)